MTPLHRTAALIAFAAFGIWTLLCVGAYLLLGVAGDLLAPRADPGGSVSEILGFLQGLGFATVVVIWLTGSGLTWLGWRLGVRMIESPYGQSYQIQARGQRRPAR